MADKNSAQQGYVTSEPFAVEHADGGFTPKVFLLADAGFDPYSTLIETSQKLVDSNPDMVQRFVDATIIGWYNYLYGDNKAANALIKKDNPRHDGRPDRLLDRADEEIRHRRFGHRRDRRASAAPMTRARRASSTRW